MTEKRRAEKFFWTKVNPLDFCSSSFQGHFTEISSFHIHSVTWMRKQISVLKRGWSYASKLALLMNPIPPSPSAEGDGGIGLHKCFRMIGNESGMISLVILNGKWTQSPHHPLQRVMGGLGWGFKELWNEERMRDIFVWIKFFHSHSKLIPSFLMRKNEKKRIPSCRDQENVTLDWV